MWGRICARSSASSMPFAGPGKNVDGPIGNSDKSRSTPSLKRVATSAIEPRLKSETHVSSMVIAPAGHHRRGEQFTGMLSAKDSSVRFVRKPATSILMAFRTRTYIAASCRILQTSPKPPRQAIQLLTPKGERARRYDRFNARIHESYRRA